jgi:tetratricopeptide (TPR) repeat protein
LLQAARTHPNATPTIYALTGNQPAPLPHAKTDLFRDRVEYSDETKAELALARAIGPAAVQRIELRLGNIADLEFAVAIDLLLSYRATSAWHQMVLLAQKMAPHLAQTVLVREQLGLALNRLGRRHEAEAVLRRLIEEYVPSSETLGILGRVLKDQWQDALKTGDRLLAERYLDQAIETYMAGFEADWRDAYPGINAVTLMEIKDPPDDRRLRILPVVRYSVERKIANGKPDYWDYATLLELSVLALDRDEAMHALQKALASIREKWEPATTARNLQLIREAREKRRTAPQWAIEAEQKMWECIV